MKKLKNDLDFKLPRFAFLGSANFSFEILKSLIKNKWIPEIIITENPKPVDRKKILTPTVVERFAREHQLNFATPTNQTQMEAILAKYDLDLSIVAAYGKIISAKALKIPRLGMINVHASLLPRYRGASPIQAAILNGDQRSGISFMLIEPTLDTGPVLAKFVIDIDDNDTTQSLGERMAELAAAEIIDVIDQYISGKLPPKPQDHRKVSVAPKLSKADGKVKLFLESPKAIDRKFRAFYPWPGIFSVEFGKRLLIRQAHFKDQKFYLDRLQWEGKKVISAQEFARRHPDILTKLAINDILVSVS